MEESEKTPSEHGEDETLSKSQTSSQVDIAAHKRYRYSMNYQSYEATRIQPGEQTRRMLDYMFQGYQKRDPRNWYEMQTQTDLGARQLEGLIGTELIETETVVLEETRKSWKDKLFEEEIEMEEKKDAVKLETKQSMRHAWEGPPIKIIGKSSEEGLNLVIDDYYHSPQTVLVPKQILEQQSLKVDIVPDEDGIPKVIIYLGDKEDEDEEDEEENLEQRQAFKKLRKSIEVDAGTGKVPVFQWVNDQEMADSEDDATHEVPLSVRVASDLEEPEYFPFVRDSLDKIGEGINHAVLEDSGSLKKDGDESFEMPVQGYLGPTNSIFLNPVKSTGSHLDVEEFVIPTDVKEGTPENPETSTPPEVGTPPEESSLPEDPEISTPPEVSTPPEESSLPEDPETSTAEPLSPSKKSSPVESLIRRVSPTPPSKSPSPVDIILPLPDIQIVELESPPHEETLEEFTTPPLDETSIISEHDHSPTVDRVFSALDNYPQGFNEFSPTVSPIEKAQSPSSLSKQSRNVEEIEHPLMITGDYPPQYDSTNDDGEHSGVSTWLDDNVISEAQKWGKASTKPSSSPQKTETFTIRDQKGSKDPSNHSGLLESPQSVDQVNEWLDNEVILPAAAESWLDKEILNLAEKKFKDSNLKRSNLKDNIKSQIPPEPVQRLSDPSEVDFATRNTTPDIQTVEEIAEPHHKPSFHDDQTHEVEKWLENEIFNPAEVEQWVDKRITKPATDQVKVDKRLSSWLNKEIVEPVEAEKWIGDIIINPSAAEAWVDEAIITPAEVSKYSSARPKSDGTSKIEQAKSIERELTPQVDLVTIQKHEPESSDHFTLYDPRGVSPFQPHPDTPEPEKIDESSAAHPKIKTESTVKSEVSVKSEVGLPDKRSSTSESIKSSPSPKGPSVQTTMMKPSQTSATVISPERMTNELKKKDDSRASSLMKKALENDNYLLRDESQDFVIKSKRKSSSSSERRASNGKHKCPLGGLFRRRKSSSDGGSPIGHKKFQPPMKADKFQSSPINIKYDSGPVRQPLTPIKETDTKTDDQQIDKSESPIEKEPMKIGKTEELIELPSHGQQQSESPVRRIDTNGDLVDATTPTANRPASFEKVSSSSKIKLPLDTSRKRSWNSPDELPSKGFPKFKDYELLGKKADDECGIKTSNLRTRIPDPPRRGYPIFPDYEELVSESKEGRKNVKHDANVKSASVTLGEQIFPSQTKSGSLSDANPSDSSKLLSKDPSKVSHGREDNDVSSSPLKTVIIAPKGALSGKNHYPSKNEPANVQSETPSFSKSASSLEHTTAIDNLNYPKLEKSIDKDEEQNLVVIKKESFDGSQKPPSAFNSTSHISFSSPITVPRFLDYFEGVDPSPSTRRDEVKKPLQPEYNFPLQDRQPTGQSTTGVPFGQELGKPKYYHEMLNKTVPKTMKNVPAQQAPSSFTPSGYYYSQLPPPIISVGSHPQPQYGYVSPQTDYHGLHRPQEDAQRPYTPISPSTHSRLPYAPQDQSLQQVQKPFPQKIERQQLPSQPSRLSQTISQPLPHPRYSTVNQIPSMLSKSEDSGRTEEQVKFSRPAKPRPGIPRFPDYEDSADKIKEQVPMKEHSKQSDSKIITAADKMKELDEQFAPIRQQIQNLKNQMYQLTPSRGPPIQSGPEMMRRLPTSLELYNELEKRAIPATRPYRSEMLALERKKRYEEEGRRKIQRAIER